MVLLVHLILVACIFIEFSPEPLPPKKVLQGMLITRTPPVVEQHKPKENLPAPPEKLQPQQPVKQQADDAMKRKPAPRKLENKAKPDDKLSKRIIDKTDTAKKVKQTAPEPKKVEPVVEKVEPVEQPISTPKQPTQVPKKELPELKKERQPSTTSPVEPQQDIAPVPDIVPPRIDASLGQNPAPPYPRISRRLKEEGTVLLEIYILANGQVGEMRIKQSSGYTRLDQAARAAVAKWRYQPARKNGQTIGFWYVQPIYFSLTKT